MSAQLLTPCSQTSHSNDLATDYPQLTSPAQSNKMLYVNHVTQKESNSLLQCWLGNKIIMPVKKFYFNDALYSAKEHIITVSSDPTYFL